MEITRIYKDAKLSNRVTLMIGLILVLFSQFFETIAHTQPHNFKNDGNKHIQRIPSPLPHRIRRSNESISISNSSSSSGWKPFFPNLLDRNKHFHHRTMSVTPNPIQIQPSGSGGPMINAKYSQLKPVYLPPKSLMGNYKSTFTQGPGGNAWKPTVQPQSFQPQNGGQRAPPQNLLNQAYVHPAPQNQNSGQGYSQGQSSPNQNQNSGQAYSQGQGSSNQHQQIQFPVQNQQTGPAQFRPLQQQPQFQTQATPIPQFQPQATPPPQLQPQATPPPQFQPQGLPQPQFQPQPQTLDSAPDLSNTEMRFLFHRPEDESLIKSSIMKESSVYNENVSFLRGPSLKFSRKQTIVLPPKKRNVIYVMLKEPELNTNLEIIEPMEQTEPEVNIIYEKVGAPETRHYYSTNKNGKLEEIHGPDHGHDHEGASSSNHPHQVIQARAQETIGNGTALETNNKNQTIIIVNPCIPNHISTKKQLRK